MEPQEYKKLHNKLLQYSKSAILFLKNGKLSRSKWTKHIKNRYFLVTDIVAQGDLKI